MIDRATTISWNQRPVVAQTIARNGLTRSVSRGNATWTFTVTMPDGPRYSDYRQALAEMESQGRTSEQTIDFASTGHSYIFGYQGDLAMPGTYYVVGADVGDTSLEITAGNVVGYKFRKGDIIQYNNYVYQVTQDVLGSASTINLHRPIIASDSPGGTIPIGIGAAQVEWRVKCIQMPTYSLFGYDQLSWDGPFVFQEVIDG